MRLECQGEPRHISINILDRDIYASAHASTPEQTSWTMRLLGRIDAAIGSGPMQKPAFIASNVPAPRERPTPTSAAGPLLSKLATGQFDDLFPDKVLSVSDLYRQSLRPPPRPSVDLIASNPKPSGYVLPEYPPLARASHTSGRVRFTAEVGLDGHPFNIQLEGESLLSKSVEAAVAGWSYATSAHSGLVEGIIEFRTNCSR